VSETLSARLSAESLDVLRNAVEANRELTLEEFGPMVRSELFHFLRERFPELPDGWLREVLEVHVVVTSGRISVDFDVIAARISDPTGEIVPSTDPSPPPDTERPS
jgi:hypothetical protein